VIEPAKVPDRGVLVGATISGVFGVAWSLWAASGLSGVVAIVVAVVGIVLGLLIIIPTVRARRSASAADGSRSMFSSRPYRLIVAGEVIAIVVGAIVLGRTGHTQYIPGWVAVAVGAHFLGFGRLFWGGYYVLGGALIAAGVVGAIVGLSGHSSGSVAATTGIIAAVSLFAAGARVLRPASVGRAS